MLLQVSSRMRLFERVGYMIIQTPGIHIPEILKGRFINLSADDIQLGRYHHLINDKKSPYKLCILLLRHFNIVKLFRLSNNFLEMLIQLINSINNFTIQFLDYRTCMLSNILNFTTNSTILTTLLLTLCSLIIENYFNFCNKNYL